MYKCDLYRTVSIDEQEVYVWDLATILRLPITCKDV